jgi:hypothetical protein
MGSIMGRASAGIDCKANQGGHGAASSTEERKENTMNERPSPVEFLLSLIGVDAETMAPAIVKLSAVALALLEAYRLGGWLFH